VLEVTGIGQREFGFGCIFSPFFLEDKTRRRRGGNVEIRLVLAGFPSPVGRVGNSLGFLGFPRFPRGVISTALVHLLILGAKRRVS